MLTRPVHSLSVSTDLIEHYEQSIHPAAGPDVSDRFEAIRRPLGGSLTTDLISVHPQGGLLRVFADASTQSGWNTERVLIEGAPAPQPVSLRAFDDSDVLTVMSRFSTDAFDQLIGMQHTPERGWQAVPLSGDVENALGRMTQTDIVRSGSGAHFIYGVSSAFDPATFVVVDTASNPWSVVYLEPATTGTTYKLLPGSDAGSLVLVEFTGSTVTVRHGETASGRITFTSGAPLDTGLGVLNADRAISVPPASPGGLSFLVLTTDGTLVRLDRDTAGAASHTVLTGQPGQPGAVHQHGVGSLPDGTVHVFALDSSDDRLWLSTLAQDSTWTPLGDLVETVAVPRSSSTPEVFLFTQDLSIAHMSRQDNAHLWSSTTVKAATTTMEPNPISAWTYEVAAKDALGRPMAGVALTVTSNRPCVVSMAGQSSHIGP